MKTSILDVRNPPHVVISDENVKRFCRGLKGFLNTGYVDDLGGWYGDQHEEFFQVNGYNHGGFKMWYQPKHSILFEVKPFDSEGYDFIFWHKGGTNVLDKDVYKIDSQTTIRKDKVAALVANVLAPALDNLGF